MLARHYGEPYADSSAMPTYYVSRMAAGHVKMVLSGDGGDESFAGYHAYQTVCNQLAAQEGARVAKEMPPLPKFFLKRWVAKLRLRQRRLADPSGEGDQALFLFSQCMSHFPYPERQKLYRPEMQRALADRVAERREFFAGSDQPLVSRLQNTDIHTYLPYDILTKVDIASMANSLEVRVPLLDHLVLELAARVPAEFKLRRCDTPQGLAFEKKFILRNVAKRYYPTDFIDRPKMGFGIPLGPWFKNELRDYIDQRLRRSQRLLALMEPRGVGEVLDTHFNHWDNSYRIWNLLFLDEWLAQNSGYRLPA
jgi:asparagine synthase (glutamine-hydrolysing)